MTSIPHIPVKNRSITVSLVVFFVVLIDQITKVIAANTLRGRPGYSFLGDLVRLEYTENTGAFLSLGAKLDPGMRTLLFVVGVLFIIAFCISWLIRKPQTWLSIWALSLVIAGGIGNLIDRVLRGAVIDFMFMGVSSVSFLRTGVFNVADVAISAGVLLMLYDQYVIEASSNSSS